MAADGCGVRNRCGGARGEIKYLLRLGQDSAPSLRSRCLFVVQHRKLLTGRNGSFEHSWRLFSHFHSINIQHPAVGKLKQPEKCPTDISICNRKHHKWCESGSRVKGKWTGLFLIFMTADFPHTCLVSLIHTSSHKWWRQLAYSILQ